MISFDLYFLSFLQSVSLSWLSLIFLPFFLNCLVSLFLVLLLLSLRLWMNLNMFNCFISFRNNLLFLSCWCLSLRLAHMLYYKNISNEAIRT